MPEKISLTERRARPSPPSPSSPSSRATAPASTSGPRPSSSSTPTVAKRYGGERRIEWLEVLAGQKAFDETGDWLPQATVDTFREYLIGIKGPLTTPDRRRDPQSLNVALRQILDLYVCLRPVRYFAGVPSPVKRPELVDMVIFRENTEDIYAGLEAEEGTPEAKKLIGLLKDNFGWEIQPDSGVGIKPISESGSKRLIRAAINYAVKRGRTSVTLVHKGNIMKFTEGAFRQLGLRAHP